MTNRGDLARQFTVLVSAVLAIVGSFIGSGAAGGAPTDRAAGGALATDATRSRRAAPRSASGP